MLGARTSEGHSEGPVPQKLLDLLEAPAQPRGQRRLLIGRLGPLGSPSLTMLYSPSAPRPPHYTELDTSS